MLFQLNNHLTLTIILFAIVSHSCQCQTQNHTYLKSQYIKDIEHLNEKIVNFQLKDSSYTSVLALPNQTQSISNTIYFEPQTVFLRQNQFAQFSYSSFQQNLINIRIISALLTEKDIQTYPTAQDHYKLNHSHFTQSQLFAQQQSHPKPCKVNDPQIQLKKLRTFILNSYNPQIQQAQQQVVVDLNDLGEYRIVRYNGRKLELYLVDINLMIDSYSRSEFYVADQLQVEGITQRNKVFVFMYERDNIIAYSEGILYRITIENDKLKAEKYAIIQELLNNQSQEQTQRTKEQPQKIIPIKYGLLIQFETYFQIYIQSIQQQPNNPQQNQPTTLIPKLSSQSITSLTNSLAISSISISQQLSHQSGYKIYILLSSSLLIQLQYGSYSSITLYKIPYGQKFYQLAVQNDIVEIIFSVMKSRKEYFYVMELLIDRKQNPRNPKIYLNRFYNDLKDLSRVKFFSQKEVIFIGEKDVLIYDWPVYSSILLKENITQVPYHFAIQNLQSIHHLQRHSTNNSDCILLVSKYEMTVAILNRKPQSIGCTSDNSFDSHIQILKFCDSNRNQLCKYIGSLRVMIQNPDSERINSIRRYLIVGLIVAIAISIVIVVKQICKNKRTIERLRKIKETIDRKFSQLEVKGKKLTQQDKFEQLQEEVQQDGNQFSKRSDQAKK